MAARPREILDREKTAPLRSRLGAQLFLSLLATAILVALTAGWIIRHEERAYLTAIMMAENDTPSFSN